jgi:hypothetical protein
MTGKVEMLRNRTLKTINRIIGGLLLLCVLLFPTSPLFGADNGNVTVNISGMNALRIVFTSAPFTINPGGWAGPITIQVQNSRGTPVNMTGPVTITLSASSSGGRFSLATDNVSYINSVVIPTGRSTATFNFTDSATGNPVITAIESPRMGWRSGTQTVVVTSGGGGGGGGGTPPDRQPAPAPKPFPVDVNGKVTQGEIGADNKVISTIVAIDNDRSVSITLPQGTQVITEGGAVPDIIIIEHAAVKDNPPAPPPGFIHLSEVHNVYALIHGLQQPVSFSPPITLIFNYDPGKVPGGAANIVIAYYDQDKGWVQVEQPPGFIAEAGQAPALVAHFTPFSVMAKLGSPPSPARFQVRGLSVNPSEVKVGEKVTISGQLINVGGLTGEHVLRVNIPGLLETTLAISLAPGQAREITFTVTPMAPGNYPVEIGGVAASFSAGYRTGPPEGPFTPRAGPAWWIWLVIFLAAAAAAYASYRWIMRRRLQPEVAVFKRLPSSEAAPASAPGALRVSEFTVGPESIKAGEAVTVTARTTNLSGNPASYSLVLKLDGLAEAVREVKLQPMQTEQIAFSVSASKPGMHEVELEGLRARFKVI